MKFTDEQLLDLIKQGYSDEEIHAIVHAEQSPADLYGAVAEVVSEVLCDEAAINVYSTATVESVKTFVAVVKQMWSDAALTEIREWWASMGIGRSDTKNIVMTFLYGSTEYGNRDGILERIDDRADECMEKALDPYWDRSGADNFKEQRTMAVTLMVRLTRGAMAVVCPSTVETMNWFQTMALILGNMDRTMNWKTLLNFPVSQSNPNVMTKQLRCYEKGKTVNVLKIKVPVEDGKRYNAKKMAAGSAPNFVHSFDACHLHMVTLETDTEYFHMIHDSMATQAVDTPEMNYQIGNQFCVMYADNDILFDVWMENDGDALGLPEPAELGSLDVNDVRKSLYFFH